MQGKQSKHGIRKKSKCALVSVVVCALFGQISMVMADDRGSPVLGSGTIPSSQITKDELKRIYDTSASVRLGPNTISPWSESNTLMQAVSDAKLDFEIKATNYSLYLQGMGSGTSQDELFNNHFGQYCAKSASNEGQGKSFACQTDALLQHGDINAASLLSGFTYTPDREIAARLFINNLVNPFPATDVSDPKMFTPDSLQDPKNRKVIAESLAEQAVLSTAREALASVLAKRKPVPGVSGNVSFMEMMEKEAAKNFLNAAWQQQMQANYQAAIKQGKTLEALQYENAMREAYTTFLLYQMYREQEESKVLMAALLAVTERQVRATSDVVKSATTQSSTSIPGTR